MPSAHPPIGPSAVLLGIDVGGSRTRVVVARGGGDLTELARAEGPGAVMRPGGAAASAGVIADAARRAAVQAGVELPADAAVAGAAGAGRPLEQEDLAAAIRATGIARRVRVLADAEVALVAAFAGGPGILLNAGTGTVAWARDPGGRLHRSGGYGWQMGDEGGGYWLGRRALEAAGRAQNGREEGSTLLSRLLMALGLQQFDDLVRWSVTATPAQVAALAPHMLNAAREGEGVAQRAVGEAASELVALVTTLEPQFPGKAPVPVATTGGLLGTDSPLCAAFRDCLAVQMPRARLADRPVDAPAGALRLAAELL